MSIKPQHLKEWDVIMALSLSRWWPGICPERYSIWKKQLEDKFWVKVIEWKYTCADPEWLYQHPEARAEDLMNAFKDPKVKAIFSTVGWEESIRILPYIDFEIIKNNPKIFMGFSDTTISHFICKKAWLVSFYGPAIMAGFWENWGLFDFMVDSVKKTLFKNTIIWEITPNTNGWTSEFLPRDNPENQKIKRKLLPSSGRRWIQWKWNHSGNLLWWCIDVFPFMLWTSIRPPKEDWNNKILCIELSEEKMTETCFERIIRNLGSQWILHNMSGILVWRSQMDYNTNEQISYDWVLKKVIVGELWLKELPIITNMDFGHTDPVFVLPLGCRAEINCDTHTFSILENACE